MCLWNQKCTSGLSKLVALYGGGEQDKKSDTSGGHSWRLVTVN